VQSQRTEIQCGDMASYKQIERFVVVTGSDAALQRAVCKWLVAEGWQEEVVPIAELEFITPIAS
jgi:hypothetical protein